MNNFGEVAVIPRDSSDPENAVGSVVLFDQGVGHVTRDECRRLAKELIQLADGDATIANATSTLLIVAPECASEEERNEVASRLFDAHDGEVIVFAYGWRTMTEEDVADLRNILNKSDKAMLYLLDTQSSIADTQ